jgi:1L-myo-inositol 1-phosphate cytidylyltransferase
MSMKCLIIAAGKGSRLKQQGDSKPLIPILGLPLIERVIRTAMETGADDFISLNPRREEETKCFPQNSIT